VARPCVGGVGRAAARRSAVGMRRGASRPRRGQRSGWKAPRRPINGKAGENSARRVRHPNLKVPASLATFRRRAPQSVACTHAANRHVLGYTWLATRVGSDRTCKMYTARSVTRRCRRGVQESTRSCCQTALQGASTTARMERCKKLAMRARHALWVQALEHCLAADVSRLSLPTNHEDHGSWLLHLFMLHALGRRQAA